MSFTDATVEAQERYLASFDPAYEARQAIYRSFRGRRALTPATPWFGRHPAVEGEE